MAKIKVKALKPIRYENKRHAVSSVISMEKEHVEALPEGTVEVVDAAAEKAAAEAAKKEAAA